MSLHIRDPETGRMVRELAVRWGVSLTQAVKYAVEIDLIRISQGEGSAGIGAIRSGIAATGRSGRVDGPDTDITVV